LKDFAKISFKLLYCESYSHITFAVTTSCLHSILRQIYCLEFVQRQNRKKKTLHTVTKFVKLTK